jgi:hypothetical protein
MSYADVRSPFASLFPSPCTTGGSERGRGRLQRSLVPLVLPGKTCRMRHPLIIGVQPTATLLVRAVAAVGIQSVKADSQRKPP